MDPEPKAHD